MFSSKEMINCWRYGQLLPSVQRVIYLGFVVLFFLPLMILFVREELSVNRLVLVDVLLGLPLLIALWLTLAIIWQGLIKTIACLWSDILLIPDNHKQE